MQPATRASDLVDITGTLITHKGSVVQHYVDAAVWAQLDNPPSVDEMKPAFKQAYKERCLASPCFGGAEGVSGRDWWRGTARRVMELCGRSYTAVGGHAAGSVGAQINVAALHAIDATPARRQPTHWSMRTGPPRLPALRFAEGLRGAAARPSSSRGSPDAYLLGICSNTPNRHSSSVLPMLVIHGGSSSSPRRRT